MDILGRFADTVTALVLMFVLPCIWMFSASGLVADRAAGRVARSLVDRICLTGELSESDSRSDAERLSCLGDYRADLTADREYDIDTGGMVFSPGTEITVSLSRSGREIYVCSGMVMGAS